jgi:hypothetical protein
MNCMVLLILTFVTISLNSIAGFEKVFVQNLDLEYTAPSGKGMVEKVGIGLNLVSVPYPIEIARTNESFEIFSPYLEFSWKNPTRFIYDIEAFSVKRTSAGIGMKIQSIESDYLMMRPKGRGEYKAENIRGICDGASAGSIGKRVLEDCRRSMDLSIKKVEIPTDFILYKLIEELPSDTESGQANLPGEDILLKMKEGDFYFQIYVRYWLRAGLRVWGKLQYENDFETIAIRVDEIKFGILPVTSFILKKLKEINNNTNVIIDPPWIRIKPAGKNEIK